MVILLTIGNTGSLEGFVFSDVQTIDTTVVNTLMVTAEWNQAKTQDIIFTDMTTIFIKHIKITKMKVYQKKHKHVVVDVENPSKDLQYIPIHNSKFVFVADSVKIFDYTDEDETSFASAIADLKR